MRGATTKIGLLNALRYRDERSKLAKTAPPWIMVWSRMLGGWSAITHGGCRYLHQAKYWFLEQVRILAKTKISCDDGLVIQEVGEIERSHLFYDIPPEKLEDISWFRQTTGSLSLLLHPELFDVGLDFDPTRIRAETLGLCVDYKDPLYWSGPGSILRK